MEINSCYKDLVNNVTVSDKKNDTCAMQEWIYLYCRAIGKGVE